MNEKELNMLEENDTTLENSDKNDEKKKRSKKLFAALGVSDCIAVPEGIWKFGAGQKIRKLTLFDQLKKSPDSGPSRAMITASSKYGFTTGGYQAEYLELTPDGFVAFNPEEDEARKLQAKFELIINRNEYFKAIYDRYKGSKMPVIQAIEDSLKELGLDESNCKKGAALFIENANYLGIIKIMSGAQRLVPIELLIEELGSTTTSKNSHIELNNALENDNNIVENKDSLDKVCFYISPIGTEESEQRKHSDLFLENIVAPAFEKLDYSVVRADKIEKPGMITSQIIDYIMNAGFVVCDLSFHNPNVFYELALRHTTKKPTIHIIRSSDNIPFDVNDFRTIVIDDSSIYTLVPALESYKNQIVQQINQLLENPETIDNPILSYLEKNQKSPL